MPLPLRPHSPPNITPIFNSFLLAKRGADQPDRPEPSYFSSSQPPVDLRRTFVVTRSPSASRALIGAPRGWGDVTSRASVKGQKADNDGRTCGRGSRFSRLGAAYWLLRLPAAHATRDIPLPKTGEGATPVPTVENATCARLAIAVAPTAQGGDHSLIFSGTRGMSDKKTVSKNPKGGYRHHDH
jgi:hypothetical protein